LLLFGWSLCPGSTFPEIPLFALGPPSPLPYLRTFTSALRSGISFPFLGTILKCCCDLPSFPVPVTLAAGHCARHLDQKPACSMVLGPPSTPVPDHDPPPLTVSSRPLLREAATSPVLRSSHPVFFFAHRIHSFFFLFWFFFPPRRQTSLLGVSGRTLLPLLFDGSFFGPP